MIGQQPTSPPRPSVVARGTRPRVRGSVHAEAAKFLLRTEILDSVERLVGRRDWSSITMTDVASETGVSRQTVYNEFRSRHGLAQGYATRLTDRFCLAVATAIDNHVGDIPGALYEGFSSFLSVVGSDPMIRSLRDGESKPDLLRLVTLDAAPMIDRGSETLEASLNGSWLRIARPDAQRISRAISRMSLSYIATPAHDGRDIADELTAVFAPVVADAAARAGDTGVR